jgi:hypothetical protein
VILVLVDIAAYETGIDVGCWSIAQQSFRRLRKHTFEERAEPKRNRCNDICGIIRIKVSYESQIIDGGSENTWIILHLDATVR